MKEKGLPNSNKEEKKPVAQKPGEEQGSIAKIQEYVEKNSKKIITITVAVIVVVALFFIIKGRIEKSAQENREQASAAITRILSYYQSGDYQKALYGDPSMKVRGQNVIGLIDIVNKYSGTAQAQRAALLAGNCFLSLNKYDNARDYFKKALDSPSNIILEGANAGMGVSEEGMGKYKEAAEYYEKAVTYSSTTGGKDKYKLFAGLCYEKSGDKDKAEKLYREIVLENESEYVGDAKAGLIRLGTIIE